MFLPNKFQQLNGENDVLLLDNTKFKVAQIKEKIIQDFIPKANDLKFGSQNSLIKKYFKEVNTQGIFNRVEWKFLLKPGIKCELQTINNTRQKGKLQIKVSLRFLSLPNSLANQNHTNYKNFDIKVSLDFYPEVVEV
ncbi:MAG: hypothetical protein N2235_00235 [Fischerella sp.]|nr:hypothetical protein [Fischerella sp.]